MRIILVVAALLWSTACQRAPDPAAESARQVASRGQATPPPTLTPAAAPIAVAPVAAAAPAKTSCGGACGGGGGGACGGGGTSACSGCALGGGCGAAPMALGDQQAIPADAQWTELKVEGMHCGGCARRIQSALAQIDGVYGSEVDLARHAVKVALRPGADPNAAAVPAIDKLGYRVVR